MHLVIRGFRRLTQWAQIVFGLALLVAIVGLLGSMFVGVGIGLVSGLTNHDDERTCEPGYGRCLAPDVSDYDCAGGTGDGPRYVEGPIEVTGRDRFALDRDGDGVACEGPRASDSGF